MFSKNIITLLVALFVAVLPSDTHAQEEQTTDKSYERAFEEELENGKKEEGDRFVTELLNMLFVLGAIVGLMLFVTWILKKMMSHRLVQGNVESQIKVLEQRALTPKSILYLIEVDGKKIVIADSPHGIRRISEIEPPFSN